MIKVDTKYTLKLYKAFCWFALFQGKFYKLHRALFFALFLLGAITSAGMYLWNDNEVLLISFLTLAAVFIVFLIANYIMQIKYYNNAPALFKSGVLFELDDKQITIIQSGDLIKSKEELRYEALYKIYETDNAFYLFIAPMQAYLLAKSDFALGTPDDLRSLLLSKFTKKKFIICK